MDAVKQHLSKRGGLRPNYRGVDPARSLERSLPKSGAAERTSIWITTCASLVLKYVREVVIRSTLDLALLSRYRAARALDDGLFLRFGALREQDMQLGVEELIDVAIKSLQT